MQEPRSIFENLARLRAQVNRHANIRQQAEKRRDEIFKEQERIRENIKSLPQNSAILRRYLDTLDTQETELDELRQRQAQAVLDERQATQALNAYIRGLTL